MIAALKIKAISTHYAPICNFCGNVCDNKIWYRKILPPQSFALTSEPTMSHFDESASLHSILKKLTSTYLLCKECFDLGNYPQILSPSDFERSSLMSLLSGDEFKY